MIIPHPSYNTTKKVTTVNISITLFYFYTNMGVK
jgi:hypothetical protein